MSTHKSVEFKTAQPNQWLGLLGGGQLGRMFCMAAQRLGYKVLVLDPATNSPAGSVADGQVLADYLDDAGLAELAQRCVGVTTEFENVPALAMETLAASIPVSPSAFSVGVAQNRIEEKSYISGCGVPVAPHAPIRQAEDITAALETLLPGILKTARLGYDGKGQVRVKTLDDVKAAFDNLNQVECVLEKRLTLLKEVSVIVARDHQGECVTFPVAENHHRKGILATTIVPARIDDVMAAQARASAISIARALDYVGVLCVEFFVVEGMGLVVNEIAPRPHNSGHYSIDACVTCQFEQQARILAGLPLGDTRQHSPSVMVNLLGDLWFDAQGNEREPNWPGVLAMPEVKLHLYGKEQARVGRKMGHITVVAATLDRALEVAEAVRSLLGIGDDDD
ncbi:5-(carboxyamino)imidazole ribonucleotide synthase [Limnobacter humi]|uniref:N5-carboxyaminoimidazole ribonucleotide synthase n=1 Tax=Limnobacter humi TaxID=1778671 RepID=A0ABT1WGZ9_9BURK|nr:5-(carboxyamino)imidazole ribonucleotide synthase [Limnobacter humi]MCQ8896807.1 5-(carboxyamino)imidazole ribonucleotide synthase [Limnobacter humi]